MQCIDFIREKMADKEPSSLEATRNGQVIHGVIVGRRSLGKKLAFADLAITQSTSPHFDETQDASINIIFTRQSFAGPEYSDDELNEAFPTKTTSLPYGASVTVELGHCQKVPSKISGEIEDVWEVTRWKITNHPKDMAEDMASLQIDNREQDKAGEQSSKHVGKSNNIIIGSGAMSCSDYLRARGEAFEVANKHKERLLKSRADSNNHQSNDRSMHKVMKPNTNSSLSKENDTSNHREIKPSIPSSTTLENNFDNIESDFHHGGKQAKAKRAKIFAAWILETFFDVSSMTEPTAIKDGNKLDELLLCQPCQPNFAHVSKAHVFDVAGGKGKLALELILQQMRAFTNVISKCTIIDPMIRKSDAKQRHAKLKKAASRLRKPNHEEVVDMIEHLATCFTKENFLQIYNQSVQNSSREENDPIPTSTLLLGLHPDECTEDILDAALEHNLSVAIIPCCVFADLYPSRTLTKSINGDYEKIAVRNYSDFLQYLLDKDETLQMAILPFEGKNKVIYRRVEASKLL